MDGDGAVDLAAAPEKAPERELDFSGIAVGRGHPREDLRGVVEAVVDEVIETDVVVAWQTYRARGTVATSDKPGRGTHRNECQRQYEGGQLEHALHDTPRGLVLLIADRAIRPVVHPLAQVLARLEMRHILARERHRLAGLRIAPLARRAKVQ